MASGNFLIGSDLSMEGFGHYIQPVLEEKGYSVQDRLVVPESDHKKTLLVSVVGEGDLEKEINGILVESGPVIEKEETEKRRTNGSYDPVAWKHQVSQFSHWQKEEGERDIEIEKGMYEVIGVYQADDTASQLFPAIAQEYLLKRAEIKADEVAKKVKALFGKRICEL